MSTGCSGWQYTAEYGRVELVVGHVDHQPAHRRGGAGELDPGQPAHRAATAVGADQVSGP